MDKNKWDSKRIIALVGLIAIVIMIIATLITAICDPTGIYFRSCLIVTIALPIALWVFIWAYGAMVDKHTVASMDLLKSDDIEGTQESADK